MMSWLHNWIWIQQDYLWFLAGIGWLTVGTIWWQQRRSGEMPGWIPWSAGTGIAIAVTQILILVTPVVHLVPNQAPSLRGDMCLGVILAVQAAGWWITGLRQVKGGAALAGVFAVLALLASAWRYDRPMEGVVAILVVLLGAGIWWNTRSMPANAGWRVAMTVNVAAVLVGTISPFATATVAEQRWFDFSPFGPWAALAQFAAAIVVVVCTMHGHQDLAHRDQKRQMNRWMISGAAVWLFVGLVFAIAVGAWGRHTFEFNALGRVRALAALLPQASVEPLLNDQFQIGSIEWFEFPDGRRTPIARSDHARDHAGALAADIWQIAQANPDVRWVTVSCMRKGWVTAAAFAWAKPKDLGHLELLREADSRDEADWAQQRASALSPRTTNLGEMVVVRAPILNSTKEIVGWLDFHFTVSQWVAAQAQPRTLAYLIIALGLVIGRQLAIQRVRSRERDEAQADALAATTASKLKTTFLANVSHELRTPLQSIQGYTELILPNVPPRERERLMAVREHADLMNRLVNDLIDLSAAESGRFHVIERPVVLMDLVVQATESLRHRAESKDLSLSVDVSPELPGWLYADPQRVRQVVLNLVSNAIKYTDAGSVAVVLALVGRDRDSAEVELRVTDTGPGVPLEKQPYLFEAFHRLEQTQEREGTGLGLAIVAAVSKAMAGSVRIRSDGRTGSTFTARWRLRLAPNVGTTPSSRVPLHGKKILVADDNALVRDLFVAYLTECGAVCATAGDGMDAIRRLRGEEFDAVVLDLAMPRLDGLAAVRQIRREMPDKQWRIIGVSAHAGGAEHDEALAAGMDGFLIKPVALPELARALAPTTSWTPPSRSFEPIRAHITLRFRTDAPAQSAALARALDGGRWPEIHAAAHYLKNSADVVGDDELARACAALEAAARARDRKAGDEAWRSCRLALVRWLSEPAAN